MTRPAFNGVCAGFNKNGLVIVRLHDGSVAQARQTGNGLLKLGQPVVYSPGPAPGLAGVCYDPTAVGEGETRRWKRVSEGNRSKEQPTSSGPGGSPPPPAEPPPPPSTGPGGQFTALVIPSGHFMFINQGDTIYPGFPSSTDIFNGNTLGNGQPAQWQRLVNLPSPVKSFRWGIGRKTIFSAYGPGWYLGYDHPIEGRQEFFEYAFYVSYGAFTPLVYYYN